MLDQQTIDLLDDLEEIANLLKSTFVSKDEMVELLATCVLAQEHLLIVGPPGTAKSELIKRFALLCSGTSGEDGRVNYFEYLLTRFTEPNEIFGPVDISAFREGEGARRNTEGMLPNAEIAFLDEVFKANSAILNALLTILNERVFYNGNRHDQVPLICAIGATNAVPDDVELGALYDRFLLRVWTDNVEETRFGELFSRGWELERQRIADGYAIRQRNILTTDSLRNLYQSLARVDLGPVGNEYREIIRRIRSEGVQLSDRRVIKLLKLVAASALRHRRTEATPADFWVLRHVWNDPEQVPHLQTIVNPYVDAYEGETWSPERRLNDIRDDLGRLEMQRTDLKTDTDFLDFLQQIESLRRELLRHSAAGDQASNEDQALHKDLVERINTQVDNVMQVLESTL